MSRCIWFSASKTEHGGSESLVPSDSAGSVDLIKKWSDTCLTQLVLFLLNTDLRSYCSILNLCQLTTINVMLDRLINEIYGH